jgi:hypothetical protein
LIDEILDFDAKEMSNTKNAGAVGLRTRTLAWQQNANSSARNRQEKLFAPNIYCTTVTTNFCSTV